MPKDFREVSGLAAPNIRGLDTVCVGHRDEGSGSRV